MKIKSAEIEVIPQSVVEGGGGYSHDGMGEGVNYNIFFIRTGFLGTINPEKHS